jgi:hypothetical protein
MHWLPTLGTLQMVEQYTRRTTGCVAGVVSDNEPRGVYCIALDQRGDSDGQFYSPTGHEY